MAKTNNNVVRAQNPNQTQQHAMTTSSPEAMTANTQKVSSYIAKRQNIYVTQPGYEVLFYSRFDPDSHIDEPESVKTSLEDITPTFVLKSDISRDKVAEVQSIEVQNAIGMNPCTATIQIVYPDSTNYFKETIGQHGEGGTDYDYTASPDKIHRRIDVMDTIVIRLKNTGGKNIAKYGDSQALSEIVFRGVISRISRSRSVEGGNLVTLYCFDMAIFLKRAVALRMGWFSTLAKSGTGRSLIDQLLNYANALYNNKFKVMAGFTLNSKNILQQLQDEILGSMTQNKSGDPQLVTFSDSRGNMDHSMQNPPYFYLQYSQDFSSDTAFGDGKPSAFMAPFQKYFATSQNTWSSLLQSPEDIAASNIYGRAFQQNVAQLKNQVMARTNSATDTTPQAVANNASTSLQAFKSSAWVLSDLYLDNLLISFEHEQLWPLMTRIADRAMREVYVDFCPKLNPSFRNSLDVADPPTRKTNQNLANVHPNIAVVKYRLSPWLIPYQDSMVNDGYFYVYDVTDDLIVDEEASEDEEKVFTAAIGFGSGLDANSIFDDLAQNFAGEAKGLLAYVQSPDTKIEKRIGYRFMTDHSNDIRIPVIMYMTSQISLVKSQMSMFSDEVTLLGNPFLQPGSVVKIHSRKVDYYCTAVTHSWDLNNGYTTKLKLEFGRTTGTFPTFYDGLLYQANVQCDFNHQVIDDAMTATGNSPNTTIGGVTVECLVEAIWNFVNGGSSTLNSDGGIISGASRDWVKLIFDDTMPTVLPNGQQGPPAYTYDSVITNALKNSGLLDYNVTLNTIKNLIYLESKYNGTSQSGAGAVGYFQLLSVSSAPDFNSCCSVALPFLRSKFELIKAPKGCAGATFLKGIQAYNGLVPDGSTDPGTWNTDNGDGRGLSYPYEVLGDQCYAIASGAQSPANPQFSTRSGQAPATDGSWPFQVYGALGLRVHQASNGQVSSPSDPRYNTWKKQLTSDIATSLKVSIPYIVKTLQKYSASTSTIGNGAPFDKINQSDTLEKTLAAWYSDESSNNVDSAKMQAAIDSIKQLYQACLNCRQTQISLNAVSAVTEELGNIKFQVPVDPSKISDYYIPEGGLFNVDRGDHYHHGIDITPKDGTGNHDILAAADGVVTYSGYSDNVTGNMIIIQHDPQESIYSWYFHMNTLNVSVGQKVKRGDAIAKIGNGGDSTGYHLHFGVCKGGNISGTEGNWSPMNPLDYISPKPQIGMS